MIVHYGMQYFLNKKCWIPFKLDESVNVIAWHTCGSSSTDVVKSPGNNGTALQ